MRKQEKPIQENVTQNEEIARKLNADEFIESALYSEQAYADKYEVMDILNILTARVDLLQNALLAVTDKLDSEDVTDLDTDYTETAQAEL